MKNQPRKVMITLIAVALALILSGASYAYFTASLGAQEYIETISLAGGFSLEYK